MGLSGSLEPDRGLKITRLLRRRHKMKIKKRIPDWIIGIFITLFFLFITLTGVFDFTNAIEMKTFDFRSKLAAPRDRNPDIEIVVISEDDLSAFGRWPWSRDILAKGII